MELSEESVRQRLIDRLLELGYPKSSILLEVSFATSKAAKAKIDLAIKDPNTNQLLAIFEIGKNLKNLEHTITQAITYAKLLPKEIQVFIYILNNETESAFLVNTKNGDASQVFDLPSYDSLKNIDLTLHPRYAPIKSNKSRARAWSTMIAGMTSSIAAVATIAMLFGLISDNKKTLSNGDLTEKLTELEAANKKLDLEIKSLNTEVKGLVVSVKSISSIPNEHGWKIEAELLSAKLGDTTKQLEALEAAITENPAKALAVPILRKDLNNAEKSIRAELTQTKSEIDRMYDQNKWFIGLMFTIALSVLGMAASTFFNRKDS